MTFDSFGSSPLGERMESSLGAFQKGGSEAVHIGTTGTNRPRGHMLYTPTGMVLPIVSISPTADDIVFLGHDLAILSQVKIKSTFGGGSAPVLVGISADGSGYKFGTIPNTGFPGFPIAVTLSPLGAPVDASSSAKEFSISAVGGLGPTFYYFWTGARHLWATENSLDSFSDAAAVYAKAYRTTGITFDNGVVIRQSGSIYICRRASDNRREILRIAESDGSLTASVYLEGSSGNSAQGARMASDSNGLYILAGKPAGTAVQAWGLSLDLSTVLWSKNLPTTVIVAFEKDLAAATFRGIRNSAMALNGVFTFALRDPTEGLLSLDAVTGALLGGSIPTISTGSQTAKRCSELLPGTDGFVSFWEYNADGTFGLNNDVAVIKYGNPVEGGYSPSISNNVSIALTAPSITVTNRSLGSVTTVSESDFVDSSTSQQIASVTVVK